MTTDLFDAQAAGAYLGGSKPYAPQTLANWRVRGVGPAFVKQANGTVRYRRDDLDAWLAKSTRSSSTSGAM